MTGSTRWTCQVLSLEVAAWAHEMSGHGGAAAVQTRDEPTQTPLAPCEAQNATKNYSDYLLRRQLCWGKIPQGHDLLVVGQWNTLEQC